MLKIAEKFFFEHGLRFSTDPNPIKSKTKCIAWPNKERLLPEKSMSGNPLPWVAKGAHLGVTPTNQPNILDTDMTRKNTRYVAKNIELNQEFFFASALLSKQDFVQSETKTLPYNFLLVEVTPRCPPHPTPPRQSQYSVALFLFTEIE